MQSGSQELRQYTRIILSWWWLFVLCVGVSVAAAYFASEAIPPEYTSAVQILVESSQQGTPSQADVITSENLAENYTDLVTLSPTLENVARNLPGGSLSPGSLKKSIKASSLGSSIITISATDPDRVMAATIANVTADVFIRGILDRQLSQLARFEEVLIERGIEPDPVVFADRAAGLDILSVVEPAAPSRRPSNDYLLWYVGIAAGLGLVVAVLGVVSIAYLDDKIKSAEDLRAAARLLLLGSIPRFRASKGSAPSAPGDQLSLGVLAESYKFVWTNLGFASRDSGEVRTLAITSPGISEGKTVTATNLAISAAKQGKSVILVDFDFRAPSLRAALDVEGGRSFIEVLAGEATLDEALAPTSIDGLRVIGDDMPFPGADIVIPAAEMTNAIQELKARADLVIFDSSPLFAVTDALMIASMVDGVLLVVDSNKTQRDSVTRAVEVLEQANARVLGAVLNRVRIRKPAEEYVRRYLKRREPPRKGVVGALSSLPVISGLVLGTILLGLVIALVIAGFPGAGV